MKLATTAQFRVASMVPEWCETHRCALTIEEKYNTVCFEIETQSKHNAFVYLTPKRILVKINGDQTMHEQASEVKVILNLWIRCYKDKPVPPEAPLPVRRIRLGGTDDLS